jgi:hypothetical protein
MGAGRPALWWRWRQGLPASAATENPWGCGGASVSTAQAGCHAPASEAVTAVTGYSFEYPSFFGQPAKCDVAHTSPPVSPLKGTRTRGA